MLSNRRQHKPWLDIRMAVKLSGVQQSASQIKEMNSKFKIETGMSNRWQKKAADKTFQCCSSRSSDTKRWRQTKTNSEKFVSAFRPVTPRPCREATTDLVSPDTRQSLQLFIYQPCVCPPTSNLI